MNICLISWPVKTMQVSIQWFLYPFPLQNIFSIEFSYFHIKYIFQSLQATGEKSGFSHCSTLAIWKAGARTCGPYWPLHDSQSASGYWIRISVFLLCNIPTAYFPKVKQINSKKRFMCHQRNSPKIRRHRFLANQWSAQNFSFLLFIRWVLYNRRLY